MHPQAARGVSFTTVNIYTPVYLKYLHDRVVAAGIPVIRGSVQHISQVVEGGVYPFVREGVPKPPYAIVVCIGLGARTLGGVEDKDVYASRGQNILLRAPWIQSGRTISSGKGEGLWTYLIPRRSGNVGCSC